MPTLETASRPADPTTQTVRRRRVFYLSGFDPRGPSFYHRLLRDEAGKHNSLAGGDLTVGPRRTLSALVQRWTVTSGKESDRVETSYEFLRWDDIIRANWPKKLPDIWRDAIWALFVLVKTGVAGATFRCSYPIGISMIMPVGIIVARFLLILTAAIVGLGLARLFGVPLWTAAIPIFAAGYGIWVWGRRLEDRLNFNWLSRIEAFLIRDARKAIGDYEERKDLFARYLVEAASEKDADEILVVGHSLGTHLAISVVARALMLEPRLGQIGPTISLLTLGQTVPMMALLPEAQWFRDELRLLGESRGIAWIDFSAPPDGACYAMVDPVTATNPGFRRSPQEEPCPKLLNAKMMDLIDADTYQQVKRDWMRVHFQYLMAGDRLADYDYFRIIGGAKSLPDRYRDRPSVTDFKRLRLFPR